MPSSGLASMGRRGTNRLPHPHNSTYKCAPVTSKGFMSPSLTVRGPACFRGTITSLKIKSSCSHCLTGKIQKQLPELQTSQCLICLRCLRIFWALVITKHSIKSQKQLLGQTCFQTLNKMRQAPSLSRSLQITPIKSHSFKQNEVLCFLVYFLGIKKELGLPNEYMISKQKGIKFNSNTSLPYIGNFPLKKLRRNEQQWRPSQKCTTVYNTEINRLRGIQWIIYITAPASMAAGEGTVGDRILASPL